MEKAAIMYECELPESKIVQLQSIEVEKEQLALRKHRPIILYIT